MFSQNVFSARDVQVNSALSENNAWDSQQYSQVMHSSQNSQMSSMEMFSQQKGPIPSKFDQYQRSQSQTTEDEPPNYYSKYVSNPPLFPASSKNNKLTKSMQAFIKEEKQNISMKEERDMLQTFINLLKDYTKEVDSSFTNFKNDMETTLQAIVKNMQDGSQRIDDKVMNLKQELVSIIEAKGKNTHEKRALNENISEQSGTIKVLETKAGILEKQLDEMKNKESAYVDQKSKFQELEQKYLQCINQWNANQASCLGNTPPSSQHTDPLCGYQIPPLHHNKADPGTYKTFPNGGPSYGYRYNPWQTGQTNDYYNPVRNNPLPPDHVVHQKLPVNPMVNPTLPIHPMVNPNLPYANNNTGTCAPNPSYSIILATQAGSTSTTSHLGTQNSMSCQVPSRANQLYSTPNKSTPVPTHCSKVRNTGSPTPRSCGLKVSRRNSKRPKQSPMAMVKPQVRNPPPLLDDEIFLVDVIDPPETSWSMESLLDMDDKNPIPSKPANSAKHTPQSGPFIRNTDSDVKRKWCRQEDTVKRKRTSVSMLGVSSDDSEVQEIANLLREQSRHFSKRTKSMP